MTLSTNMAAPMGTDNDSATSDGKKGKHETSWLLHIVQRKDFLFGVCGASAFLSFCYSLHKVRRTARKYSKQALTHTTKEIPEVFAMKALTMGTIVAVSSFSLFWWCIFKVFGTNNIYEFHAKLRTYFPEKEHKGRTEFANLRELADYLISEDRKAELAKKKKLEDSTPKES